MNVLTLVLTLLVMPVAAQQPSTDPVFLQKAITALQQQRNLAFDGQASCEVQRSTLVDEIAKLNSEIAELKKGKPVEPPAKK